MIRMGATPEVVNLLIIVLLPKPAGGDRPIGIFPTVIRALNRWLRSTYGEKWRTKHDRPYFYGAKGRGATVCNWRVAAFAEYAKATGKHAVAALFDIVKAYENITHARLKQEAEKHGFSLALVRYLISIYAMPRCIRVGQVATEIVRASRTVVPGDSFADLLMRLSIMSIMDLLAETWPPPRLHIGVIVDDIQLLALGNANDTASTIAEATTMLVEGMDEAGLQISSDPQKLSVVTSTEQASKAIVSRMRIRGQRCGKASKRQTRNLGVDMSFRGRATKVQQQRLKKAQYRAQRYARVKKAGISVRAMAPLAKAGINSVGLYGVGITGMSDSALSGLRATVHGAIVAKPHGRSATADLEMAGANLDPAYEATLAPLLMWSLAIWNQWVPRIVLIRSFAKARTVMQAAKVPWQVAVGPASVVLACLKRIGWEATSPFLWKTAKGMAIDLDEMCAADLARLIRYDVRKWLWSKAADHRHGYRDFTESHPFTNNILTLLRRPPTAQWSHEHKGMLRAVVAEASWGNKECSFCGEEWSAWHDAWQCPAMQPYRRQHGLATSIMSCGTRGQHVAMFSNSLVPEPIVASPSPLTSTDVTWSVASGGMPLFGSEGFGDGSGMLANHYASRRCGWAVVAVERVGASAFLGTSAYAPLVGPIQEVPLAELYALLFFITHSMPAENGSLTFYTDCKWVVDTFASGWAVATQPMAVFAGVWRKVFKAIDDVLTSVEQLHLIKVKGHATAISCGNDEVLMLQKRGNDEADILAKKGAMLHPMDANDCERLRRISLVQPIVATYLARIGVAKLERYGKDAIPTPQANAQQRLERHDRPCIAIQDGSCHRICTDLSTMRVRCSLCLASADTANVLCKAPCRSTGASREHIVWTAGDFVFCTKCGAHSAVRTNGLSHSCLGGPASDSGRDRRNRLLKGRHPITNAFMAVPVPGILVDEWQSSCQSVPPEPLLRNVAEASPLGG